MTLRLRLVLAVGALLVVGFGLFGVISTSAYKRALTQRLDDRARSVMPLMSGHLRAAAGLGVTARDASAARASGPVAVIPGTYGELRDAAGTVLARAAIDEADVRPALPDVIDVTFGRPTYLEVGSQSGRGRWRAVASVDRDGTVQVVAVPLSEVDDATSRLIVIEAATAAAMIALLGAATWLILRRGLRPLETMAGTAATIAAGDLTPRVAPADSHSEVGQLGLALNTMLDGIEAAFNEREATEQRLRQFLADASHELRTPLTSIQGFAELFRLAPDSPQVDLPVILRRIEQESGRMKVLVEDMLLLARLEDTHPAGHAPVDLAVIAADACTDAVALDRTRAITLDAPEPVVVSGVADHLRQAAANLVVNAVRHTPDGTPIHVSARLFDAHAVLTVRDHGPGLDHDALAHVFDRFWRADKSRTGSGAGLGLAIVQGIAAEHDGTVTATNAPGGGASFTLSLPLPT